MSNGPNNPTGPSSRMLIDAAHPEETRVVVLKGNRVEEFDFESASKKQLRGNIYLAKVTRVEPSLQAAFVEYGGNRHGFLAFSEIHPDYYQIPFADRQALLEEEARAHRDEDDEPRESRGDRGGERGGERGGRRGGEGRSNGGGRGEPREARSEKNGGEGRSERNARGEGRGNRDGREGREGRGERGQRRSRRHRRDSAPATALDRRDVVDESISGPAFEVEDGLIAAEAPLDLALETQSAPVTEAAGMDEAAYHDAADPVDAVASDARAEIADAPEPIEAESSAETAGVEVTEVSAVAVSAIDVSTADVTAERPDEAAADAMPASVEAVSDEVHAEAAEAGATQADVTAAAAESYVVETHADDAHHGDVAPHAGADEPAPSDDEPEARDEVVASEPAAAEPAIAELGVVEHAAEADAVEPEEEHVEQIGGDALSDVAPRPVRLRRHYKIQEVIKRRQILLIQVVKEERGNKGAALTTYLSLAGRYSVLMPNTAKGGGISRKITDGEDRKRLKAIAGELDVPEGMGVILRTAGASRTPIEVKRDFEYLLRMWESVRELTLKSAAPTLVYEEGSLIKRSIRDLYSRDVEEVVVSGEAGFAEARDFMRMLMPGNAKSVVEYRDPSPIFAKSGVEAQLDAMFSSHVTLKSGGYLVINQTEALVAIDVNSGRSTREHNIEDTALRTNMEAADEVARQLRLRDLAGLIVVDFIDMEEGRNNRAVERRIKEALKNDRARIQIGRISHFGLLEMSRQRIRTGVLEGSTVVCPHCAGTGTVRSTASIALHVLRLIEDALIKDAAYDLVVRSRGEVALYMLNQKRAKLVELEQRFGVTISVEGDASLTGTAYHAIERGDLATPAEAPAPRQGLVRVDSIAPVFDPEPEFEEVEAAESDREGQTTGASDDAEDAGEAADAADAADAAAEGGEGGERRRKRRRRRRGRERDGAGAAPGEANLSPEVEADGAEGSEFVASSEARGADAEPERMQVIGFSSEPSGADEVGTDAVRADDAAPAGRADIDAAEAVDASFAPEARGVDDAPAAEPAAAADMDGGSGGVEAVEPAETADAADAVEAAPKRRRSRRTAARAADEAPTTAEAEPTADEAPKRRRRPARARAAEVETGDAAEGAGATESAEVDAAPATPNAPATSEAPATSAEPAGVAEPLGAPPAADRDVGADTVERHGEPTGAATAVTEPEPAVEAPPQPDRPKRSGWWQRAKAPSAS